MTRYWNEWLCQNIILAGECTIGDNCTYSHNSYESEYRPTNKDRKRAFRSILSCDSKQIVIELNLLSFKIQVYEKLGSHNYKQYIRFHSFIDKIRPFNCYSSNYCLEKCIFTRHLF